MATSTTASHLSWYVPLTHICGILQMLPWSPQSFSICHHPVFPRQITAANGQDHRLCFSAFLMSCPPFEIRELVSPFSSVKAFSSLENHWRESSHQPSPHVRLVEQCQLHQSSVVPWWCALSDWWGYPVRPFADDIPLFFWFLGARARPSCVGGFCVSVRSSPGSWDRN